MRFEPFRVARVLALFLAVVLAALVGVGAVEQALAQSEAPATSSDYGLSDEPAGPSLNDYQSLAARDAEMLTGARTELEGFFGMLATRVADAPRAFDQMLRVLKTRSPTGDAWHFVDVLLMTGAFLLVAFAVESLLYGRMLVRRWFIAQQRPSPQGFVEKLPILLLRAGLGVVGLLVSVVVALALGAGLGSQMRDAATKETLIVIFVVYVMARLIALTWRLVLAPYLPDYRLTSFSNRDAAALFHWLWITATLALAFQGMCTWMAAIGLPDEAHRILTICMTFVVVLLNIAMVLVNRRAITMAIRDGKSWNDSTWPSRWASALWGPAVVGYVVFSWLVLSVNLLEGRPYGTPLILTAYVVILTVLVVYGVAIFLIQRFFMRQRARAMILNGGDDRSPAAREAALYMGDGPGDGDGDGDEEGAPKRYVPAPAQLQPRGRMRTYEDLARRVASILAVAAGVYALYAVWTDKALMAVWPSVDKVFDIAVIVLIGYVAYHALRIWIDQRIEEEGGFEPAGMPGEGEGGGAGASRLATLLPLFRNFLLALITITIGLIIALEMGVNVAPLFAGAGIVGIAIGFGSQALVRDILSGAFFLIDDAFRKGEYIDLGTVKGTVERISVRSFQLRHHLGYLHTVPFGEIQHITNFSRDWVIMKLPLRLTYDTDAEAVRKKIKKLGEKLLEHPEYGPRFLQPLKSQGVIQMEDSAMIMRLKFMTRPGDQWELRKVVFAEIRDLFEREGIRFAHREVTVRLADQPAAPLTEAQRQAVAGAVRPVLDAELADDMAAAKQADAR